MPKVQSFAIRTNSTVCFLAAILLFLSLPQSQTAHVLQPSADVVRRAVESGDASRDQINVPFIRSVQLHLDGAVMSYPAMALGGEAGLLLSFDDLDTLERVYHYTVVQYDARWQVANPRQSDYIQGFPQNTIDDYQHSIASVIPYRHFRLNIPNDDFVITQSGNYLLVVFEVSADQPLFARRFVVYEPLFPIEARLRATKAGDLTRAWHQIEAFADIAQARMADPHSDITLRIVPNGVWQLAVDAVPTFVRGTELEYRVDIAPGNEFRTINLKELSENRADVLRLEYVQGAGNVLLPTDFPRAGTPFRSSADMNGRFHIEKLDAWDDDLNPEYFYAHFTLETPQPMLDGNIFIFGALTGYSLAPWSLMAYDMDAGAYHGQLLLKQGFYDYTYLFVPSFDPQPDFARVEGNFGQTVNDYLIYMYFRDRATATDRLAGFVVVHP